MSNPDGSIPLFSPEQAQSIRDALARFGEAVAADIRTLEAAFGEYFAKVEPFKVSPLPMEES